MDSYEDIFSKMEDEYEKVTGFVPDEYSDTGIKLKILAGEIYNVATELQWFKNQMFPTTASGDYLDYHAKERGLTRKASEKASGTVTFMLEYILEEGVTIPKGTVVSTDDEEPLRFITTKTATIDAGSVYTDIEVEAEKGGSEYNVAEKTITVVVTSVPNLHSVVNQGKITGGTQEESDSELRSRLLYAYRNNNNGTNCAYYKELAENVQGVYSAGVLPKNRGTGTVDVYIAKQGAVADNDLVNQVQAIMTDAREVNVNVLVRSATASSVDIKVELEIMDGYTFDDVKEKAIAVLTEYISSLGVGGSLYLSEAGERLYHIDGVKRYHFDEDYCSDTTYPQTRVPYAGTITVEEL
jgi:uncharacterized phage protein gp47/JayE